MSTSRIHGRYTNTSTRMYGTLKLVKHQVTAIAMNAGHLRRSGPVCENERGAR